MINWIETTLKLPEHHENCIFAIDDTFKVYHGCYCIIKREEVISQTFIVGAYYDNISQTLFRDPSAPSLLASEVIYWSSLPEYSPGIYYEDIKIVDTDCSDKLKGLLEIAGISTIKELAKVKPQNLLVIKGFGKRPLVEAEDLVLKHSYKK